MESLMYFEDQEHDESNHSDLDPYPACICNTGSAKKRSPSSSSEQPNPKKSKPIIPLHPSSFGLKKLPLPIITSSPVLRRCVSDPLHSPKRVSSDVATPSPVRLDSRGLCRSVSAPEKNIIAAIHESPDSKRLKRMKERMREISKWCDEVIAEGNEKGKEEGEDRLFGAEVVNNEAPKDEENEAFESEDEAVSVEKNGNSLTIHLKCPCSKAYQFLLTGNNCYYKIM